MWPSLEMELPEFDASEDIAAAVQQPVFARLVEQVTAGTALRRAAFRSTVGRSVRPVEIEEPPVESVLPFDAVDDR